jgi:hypothetical protein
MHTAMYQCNVSSITRVQLVAVIASCTSPAVHDGTACCLVAAAAAAAAALQLLQQLKREPVLPCLDLAGVAQLIQRCAEDQALNLPL